MGEQWVLWGSSEIEEKRGVLVHHALELGSPLEAPCNKGGALGMILVCVIFNAYVVGGGRNDQMHGIRRHCFHAIKTILMEEIDARCHALGWSHVAVNGKSGVCSYSRLILTVSLTIS